MRSISSFVLLLVPVCLLTAVCGGCASSAPTEHVAPLDAALDARENGNDAREAGSFEAHYATKVVSYSPGDGGGYNSDKLPGVVLGPPEGGGCCAGSVDVVSLGNGGEIVLGFDVEIVDGPGVDFLVFENPFDIGGDPKNPLAEPGEVSVSEDGKTWTTWPCTATTYPYGACAGWHPVLATKASGVDTRDPGKAGGDPFDLADLGVARARYVRIRDMNRKFPAKDGTAGFDLDGVAVIHSSP